MGVRKSLTLELVYDALRRNNNNQSVLKVWEYNKTRFFRSAIGNTEDNNTIPLGQRLNQTTGRWNRLTLAPVENYFVGGDNQNFIAVNAALREIERAEEQMDDASDDVPIEMTDGWTQTEARMVKCGNDNIERYDGICFMVVDRMEDFVRKSTGHAALCGMPLVLSKRKMHYRGTMLSEVWQCPSCGAELLLDNQGTVKSNDVAQGATHSRYQPRINLELVKGAKLEGINMAQLEGLFTSMGIYIGSDRNLRLQATKVRSAIKRTYEERLIENRKEHVALTRDKLDYRGDVIWSKDSEVYSTCCGDICIDGAGCTRSYNHRHKGKQTAFIVSSRTTGKPLSLVVSNVSVRSRLRFTVRHQPCTLTLM